MKLSRITLAAPIAAMAFGALALSACGKSEDQRLAENGYTPLDTPSSTTAPSTMTPSTSAPMTPGAPDTTIPTQPRSPDDPSPVPPASPPAPLPN